jgi:hypothetical protein
MVALREEWSEESQGERGPAAEADGARWMSLRHASCCLDVSPSTLRRRMRKGTLSWRVINHGRRWAYEVLVPDGASPCGSQRGVVSMEAYLRGRLEEKEQEIARLVLDLQHQEEQIENLCQALARARAGNRYGPDEGPYARFRQLALSRRRWRLF